MEVNQMPIYLNASQERTANASFRATIFQRHKSLKGPPTSGMYE